MSEDALWLSLLQGAPRVPNRWVIGEGDDHETMSLEYRRDADASLPLPRP